MLECAILLLACLAMLSAACGPVQSLTTGGQDEAEVSLFDLPLPTAGAEVTPGPVVDLVVPPTPTPTPTLPANGADTSDLIQRGEQVFAANCATCHGAEGAGDEQYPALRNNAFVNANDPAPVIETVLYGRGEMPAFQDTLSNQEIAAVVSYIRDAWGNDAAAITVEQVRSVADGG
jgi:mono/diheme cytochrome c family protein